MSGRRQARGVARQRRQFEAELLRTMLPSPPDRDLLRLILRHADRVRLKDGTLLSAALGR